MTAFYAAPRVLGDVPTDFTDTLVTTAASPTALAFTSDGRLLIGTQSGVLHVFQDGVRVTPAPLTLGSSVCTDGERGLLGIAVDPSFASTGFIYVYYTHNANGCFNRLSRFVLPVTNSIDTASELVLIDNIPSPSGYHNGGDVQFGKDGYLYVSVGDGLCDYNNDSGCAAANDAARDQHSLLGKILRITADGAIPLTNPFQGLGTARCATTGGTTLGNKCQETFAWGLRNPFRMAFDPNDNATRFFINDVGQGHLEEIDLGTAGADYGWNTREGHCLADSTNCPPPPAGTTDPIFDYDHSGGCSAITGGAFVPNGIWPESYNGLYLFSDYVCGKIFTLIPGPNQTYSRGVFAQNIPGGAPIAMAFGPNGGTQALYYTSFANGGEVRRIAYTGFVNRPPVAVASATPNSGAAPLTVTLSAAGSSDPDGNPITYEWDFGDGTLHQNGQVVQHTYDIAGQFDAIVTVRDNSLASATAKVRIYPGNTAPAAVIVAPTTLARFHVGQTITLQGQAFDDDDGQLADARLTWTALKHHNTHTHPFLPPTAGNNVVITMPEPEDLAAAANSYLEVILTATDLQGLSTTVSQNLLPNKVDVSFATVPPGFRVSVNGALIGQQTVTSWEGYVLHVGVPTQADGSGHPWVFAGWSDGGAAIHDIATLSSPATYVASLTPVAEVVDTTIADFAAGTLDANTVVRETGDGEVTLAAAVTADFGGSTLPSGWTSTAWTAGGTNAVSGGALTTDGARLAVTALSGPGRSVEFVGTFSSTAALQHVGLGVDFNNAPWAIFSTMGGGALYARTTNGTATTNTLLPGSWLGAPHRFRIDWTPSAVSYAIDGSVLATHAIAIAAAMRPIVSDYAVGGGAVVTVDWLRETPYASAGTFTSRVLDVGSLATWETASWAATVPAATSIAVSIRTGNTTPPDGTWTAWTVLAGPGSISGQSRYLQYRAALATSDPAQTPTLHDIHFDGTLGAGLTIGDVSVVEGASGTTQAVFTVTLTGTANQPVTVNYTTSAGTATAGGDYDATNGVLSFPVGTTSQPISVVVHGDALNEADETFGVTLSGAVNATLGTGTGVGTILNDDPLPSLTINDVTRVEGDAGSTNSVFTMTLSEPSGRPVSVHYATADGSATVAGGDYGATSGTLTFAPGVIVQTITVPVVGNTVPEANETFNVNLTVPANVTIADAVGVGTILNDDADTTGPSITNRTPAPSAAGVAPDTAVTVTFSETLNASTVTGGSVRLRAAGAPSDVLASVGYSGVTATLTPAGPLALGTTYTATVAGTITDVTGIPLGADVTWTFTTANVTQTFTDTTIADFTAGALDANTVVRQTSDGEVTLAGAVTADFAGTAVPAGWTNTAWSSGGTSTVSGGLMTTDGARLAVTALSGPGQTVEFVATFSSTAALQHVGLGVDLNNPPWAIFSTMSGGALYARTTNGTATTNTLLPGNWVGAPHRFRIDWTPSTVSYAIDGSVLATHAIAIAAAMRPIASDYAVGGGAAVTVDWLRETPFASAGTFTSRVLDAGSVASWGTASWTATLPSATSMVVSARAGNTATPDGTWSAWVPLAGTGAAVAAQSRYLQYRAALATSDPAQTPTLHDIRFDGTLGAGLTIGDVSVVEGASGTTQAVFTVTLTGTTNQPVTVNYATSAGTATAGGDYDATNGVLSFPVGTTSQPISVVVHGDALNEADETFGVTLSDAVNATLGTAQAVGTILNDDPLPSLTINDVSQAEGDAGSTNIVFTVTLSATSGRTVTVQYATADASATAGSDYTATTGTLTFAPGVTVQTIAVAVAGNIVSEGNETFQVSLTLPTNATMADAAGVATILNDDVDTTAPTIVGRTPAPAATGVAPEAVVTVTFSEALNTATVTSGSVRLRAAGAPSDVAASIGYSGVTATLTPAGPLALGTTYTATVAGTITDVTGIPLGADVTWMFATATATQTFTDTTIADFTAGAVDANTVVRQTGDGEVTLAAAVTADFGGTTLPAGWTSSAWSAGGANNVSGGVLITNGGLASVVASSGPGRSAEFVATFNATANAQHVGLGVDLNNPPWAIFSTLSGGALYARTTNGTATTNTLLPGSWLGAPHRFRIDWTASSVSYAIDGTVLLTHPIAIAASMRPMVSDYVVGGAAVTVDWLQLTPFAAAGTFTSRVLDAGGPATWGTASWTATLPAGTSVVVSVRTGNTAVPDGSWSAWTPLAGSGTVVGTQSRYLQYRAALATSAVTQSPTVHEIAFSVTIGTP